MYSMKERGELQKQRLLTLVIIIFSAAAVIFATVWMIRLQRLEKERAQAKILEGISVFFPKEEVSALLYDGRNIWVGGRDGVNLIEPGTGDIVREVAKDIMMTYTAGMCQTPDGRVWIGHERGISVFSGEERIDFAPPQIPQGRVNTVIGDGSGGVWAGAQGGAVHFVKSGDKWAIDETLSTSSGLRDDAVNAIAIDEGKGIWFGAYLGKEAGGISILRNNQWQYFSTEEGLPHRYVTAIIPLYSQYMLVGLGHLDRGGMALFEDRGGSFALHSTYSTENGLPGEKIRQLFLDSKGHLWITSESQGLIILNSFEDLFNEQLNGVYLTVQNGLSDNEIKTIIQVEGYYWLGGRVGLTRIEESTIERLLSKGT